MVSLSLPVDDRARLRPVRCWLAQRSSAYGDGPPQWRTVHSMCRTRSASAIRPLLNMGVIDAVDVWGLCGTGRRGLLFAIGLPP